MGKKFLIRGAESSSRPLLGTAPIPTSFPPSAVPPPAAATRHRVALLVLFPSRLRTLLRRFGPGLITGAADDDPSGVVTYTQAGAAFGVTLGWTVVLSLPFMVAVQEASARLGRATGAGLAAALRRHAPRWLVLLMVGLLLVANTINLGADIGAMADVAHLVAGGPAALWAVLVTLFCASAEIWLAYRRYVQILKWLTLTLLAYAALLVVVRPDVAAVLRGAVVPRFTFDHGALEMIVAVLGTTISPYLFFWQAAEEAEDATLVGGPGLPRPLPSDAEADADAKTEISRIGWDTWVGMGYSNAIALAVMTGAAVTLHGHGVTSVASAAEAASALAPLAGPFAQLLFALGIFGTGLLAVPVLAGSSAYAIGEALGWTVGLSRKAVEARAFYATLGLATLLGLAIALSPVNTMRALVVAAVINGVVSAPLIVALVVLGSMRSVMGALVLPSWLRILGWATAALMAAASLAMLAL